MSPCLLTLVYRIKRPRVVLFVIKVLRMSGSFEEIQPIVENFCELDRFNDALFVVTDCLNEADMPSDVKEKYLELQKQVETKRQKHELAAAFISIKEQTEEDKVEEAFASYLWDEVLAALETKYISYVDELLSVAAELPVLAGLSCVDTVKVHLEEKLFQQVDAFVSEALEKFDINSAQGKLDELKPRLVQSHIDLITENITAVKGSKEVKCMELTERVNSLVEEGDFEHAYVCIDEAELTLNEGFVQLRGVVKKAQIVSMISLLKEKIPAYELDGLDEKLSGLNEKIGSDPELTEAFAEEYEEVSGLYEMAKAVMDREHALCGDFPVVPIGTFNVAKKAYAGEDSDPILDAQCGRNWGVVAVFDGMGGAGARKYVHIETNEEHTSAYWASRFVKDAVEELVKSRPIGADPVEHLEANMYRTIKQKLDDEILNFPAAKSAAISRLLAKLPTTMALCIYEIVDGVIRMNCYWAGDSRVYLFDGDRFRFLTLDDADAPDGDPFSPANMDLAMNNRICQDQPFRINKSYVEVELNPDKPIVLFAATDGCFGYYKNPIEFESMILSSMSDPSIENWLPEIERAIIENIQQDDFSMSAVMIGSTSVEPLHKSIAVRLSEPLFGDYMTWRSGERARQKELLEEITSCGDRIEAAFNEQQQLKVQIEECEVKLEEFRKNFDDNCTFLRSLAAEISIEDEPRYRMFANIIDEGRKRDEELNAQIADLREQRARMKTDLEELQLQSQQLNDEWYARYKELVEIVKPTQTVE